MSKNKEYKCDDCEETIEIDMLTEHYCAGAAHFGYENHDGRKTPMIKYKDDFDFKIKHHCSSYDLTPSCNPPCNLVQMIELGGINIESEWFNPHFPETIINQEVKALWTQYLKAPTRK